MKYSSGKGPGSNDEENKPLLLLWKKPDVRMSGCDLHLDALLMLQYMTNALPKRVSICHVFV